MQIYKVGGAVRDRLLGQPVTDIDWLVVGATVEEMLADIKDIMVLTGAATIKDLQQVRLIFTGRTLAYLQNRSLEHA